MCPLDLLRRQLSDERVDCVGVRKMRERPTKTLLKLAQIGLCGILLLLAGACVSWFSVSTEKSDEIRKLFAAELPVGSTSDEIEAFFVKHGITYSKNPFNPWYHGIIRHVTREDHSIAIKVHLDDAGNLKLVEIRDSVRAI